MMIMDDANLELAVDGCLWAGSAPPGSAATAASRVVVHRKVYRQFCDEFIARTRTLIVGDGLKCGDASGPDRTARRSCRRSSNT